MEHQKCQQIPSKKFDVYIASVTLSSAIAVQAANYTFYSQRRKDEPQVSK